MGRQLAEGAALMVDHVLPAVGYRQWVLSFDGPLAVRLGYDRALLAKVAERLARAVMQDMRWSAKEHHRLATVESLHASVLMVVQRFRSDLGLFVHLHGDRQFAASKRRPRDQQLDAPCTLAGTVDPRYDLTSPMTRRLLPLFLLACRPTATATPTRTEAAGASDPAPGSLEKDAIRAVVRTHIGEVRECYNGGLARDPSLTGQVKLQFTIERGGAVSDTNIEASTLPPAAADVADCIAAAVRTWRFPDPGGKLLISYPFLLEVRASVRSPSGLVTGARDDGVWFPVSGFPPRTVVVEVVDAASAPAIGVPVVLHIDIATEQQVRTVATDGRGRAVFPDLLGARKVHATVDADGAHPRVQSLTLTVGDTAHGVILLRGNPPG